MAQTLTPEHVQYLMDNGLRRVLRKDDNLPHQVRMCLDSRTQLLAVSCTCRARPGSGGHNPIEIRACWEPGEAIAVWREHVAEAEAVSA